MIKQYTPVNESLPSELSITEEAYVITPALIAPRSNDLVSSLKPFPVMADV